MKIKNYPATDFILLMAMVAAVWTAAVLNYSAKEKVKKINEEVSKVEKREVDSGDFR